MSIGSIAPVAAALPQAVANVKPQSKPVAASAPAVSAPQDADGDHDGTGTSTVSFKA